MYRCCWVLCQIHTIQRIYHSKLFTVLANGFFSLIQSQISPGIYLQQFWYRFINYTFFRESRHLRTIVIYLFFMWTHYRILKNIKAIIFKFVMLSWWKYQMAIFKSVEVIIQFIKLSLEENSSFCWNALVSKHLLSHLSIPVHCVTSALLPKK